MPLHHLRPWLAVASLTLALVGCKKQDDDDSPLTLAEASQAVEESSVDGQAAMVTSSTIELTTSFTIGDAIDKSLADLESFVGSQLPCADVSVAEGTLFLSYGTRPGNCTYQGRTLAGTHSVHISKSAADEVQVDHTWAALSDGRVRVDGTATVTWSGSARSRRVQHDLTWKRLRDGRTGHGTGDRTQTPLEGGVSDGIAITGSRSWTGERGEWDLGISGVQVRWADPVPQAGTYTLRTPAGHDLELSFQRVDEDTIKVTASSGKRSFSVNVSRLGDVN